MSSDIVFVKYVTHLMENAGNITYKNMFGEYGIYCDGIFIGDICKNQLYIKITAKGREYIQNIVEASPYPGSKKYFLIGEEIITHKWLSELVKITTKELAKGKAKRKLSKISRNDDKK
jgi:TfoX/Sxy family transcriptional regulator of competence genes